MLNSSLSKFQISCIGESVNELTFNVTCSNCTMETDVNMAPRPDNLQVLGKGTRTYYK